ncbi:hypothetical protein BLA29_013130 [Euroglyphus maynei]|uniref:Uncharacterized protein n=1 Tax=Euroglyphus maynei TaxID=6958 RepID=A0A1Y3BA25_EURMA|nr:hypothetical protein BLA29_013130 [Euroglyphus maynei]
MKLANLNHIKQRHLLSNLFDNQKHVIKIIMGRKAKFDTKQPKGPGRKARKQGEVDVKLFLSNVGKNSNKTITPISKR